MAQNIIHLFSIKVKCKVLYTGGGGTHKQVDTVRFVFVNTT